MPIEKINCKKEARRDYLKDLSDDELLRHQGNLDNSSTVVATLFRALKGRKNNWVPVPALGKAAATRCMAGNIARLREKGCLIDSRIVWPDEANHPWVVHVFYKLVAEPRDEIERRRTEPRA
jgi:hypothetical protein